MILKCITSIKIQTSSMMGERKNKVYISQEKKNSLSKVQQIYIVVTAFQKFALGAGYSPLYGTCTSRKCLRICTYI